MEIKIVKIPDDSSDAKIVGIFEGEACQYNDTGIQAMIGDLIREGEFSGEFGAIESLVLPGEKNPHKIILAGLGKKDEFNAERLRKIAAKVIKEGKRIKAHSVSVEPVGDDGLALETSTRIWAEIPLLADYKFDTYQKEKKPSTITEVNILCRAEADLDLMKEACREGRVLARETVFARDLVNEPANVSSPLELANRAKEAGEKCGFTVEILDEEAIGRLGMEAFLAVARASENPPVLIVMRYLGDDQNREDILGIAGKGLTYDSGGLCIKTESGMRNMRADMGGAAAVIGAMSCIAQLKLKANVVGTIAACENMISGKAYRTGDIIGSMAGKTIFVENTDAEGRLTLIDAIHYLIEKERVNRVLDIATLTGTAGITLGNAATPVISNDDAFFREVERASELADEKIWRLPCFEEYAELLKSPVADLTNLPGNPGTITAGLFIREFVQDKAWVHLDIAATSWADKASDYSTEGGTGVGVRTLYHLVKNQNR